MLAAPSVRRTSSKVFSSGQLTGDDVFLAHLFDFDGLSPGTALYSSP